MQNLLRPLEEVVCLEGEHKLNNQLLLVEGCSVEELLLQSLQGVGYLVVHQLNRIHLELSLQRVQEVVYLEHLQHQPEAHY